MPSRSTTHQQRPHHLSVTAAYVAYLTAWLSRRPGRQGYIPAGAGEATIELLSASGLLSPTGLTILKRPLLGAAVELAERFTAPGQVLEVGLRRCLVEDETREAIAAGADQVLCAGAGFDTLCSRLAREFPEVTFWELDHPATARLKVHALKRLGWCRPNLRLLAGDFTGGLIEAFPDLDRSWNRRKPAVLIAEGLLMYLPQQTVDRFFADASRLLGSRSTLIMSYLEADRRGRPLMGKRSGWVRALLTLVGEPIRWSLDTASLRADLSQGGFDAIAEERLDLRRRYLNTDSQQDGLLGVERCMVARRR